MLNQPRTELRRQSLSKSLLEQLSNLKENIQKLERNEKNLDVKVTKIRHQHTLLEKKKEETKFLISKLERQYTEVQNLHYEEIKESSDPKNLEQILEENGTTLQNYREGLISPTLLQQIGLKPFQS